MKDIILIGAGMRGSGYSGIGKKMEDGIRVVAVAEPVKERREHIQKMFDIPDELCFESWEPLIEKGKIADAAMVTTMDRDHFAPAVAAIRQGYNLILEKPIAPTPEECIIIDEEAKKAGVFVLICFVLRYGPFFKGLKQLLKDGAVGEVVNIQHAEDVGNVHQSHSFVRGNWGNTERSSFMLLQKSSHDTDILYWLLDKKCKSVSSFGSRTHFVRANAPEGAPEYCIEGCPHADSCYYNAVKLYLEGNSAWFRTASTKKTNPTNEDVEWAIRNTQYGKCVYKCDNDVVDHQIVNFEFEDGITATFTMTAFSKGGRRIVINGTKGVITAEMSQKYLTLYSFDTKTEQQIEVSKLVTASDITGGHGGGDDGVMNEFVKLLNSDKKPVGICYDSVYGHMLAFAAEEARLSRKVIDVDEYIEEIKEKAKAKMAVK
ncbi:MAG: Gfo/Idh/MocA family oxidoreductase [Ruminococcaceae bacterium]|nr:Gfo/Idh/MocA family oxidoreductase [Oscillospiraceae bacterium]